MRSACRAPTHGGDRIPDDLTADPCRADGAVPRGAPAAGISRIDMICTGKDVVVPW
jgi:hypothetical protein